MVDWNQAGYIGQSMSVRAAEAYESGEKPLSKWTKADILDEVREACPLAEKLTLSELKDVFLEYSSWHHMGKYAVEVSFYSLIDEDAFPTEEKINGIIANRKPRIRKPKEKPLYITSFVAYVVWEGTRKHPKPVDRECVVRYMSDQKMAKTIDGWKRLTSLQEKASIKQKTKFASDKAIERLLKKEGK